MPVEYIISYKEISHALLSQAYDARLWASASLLFSFCSDDRFYDFRGWLIAKGQSVYEGSLRDPDTLADVVTSDGDYSTPMLVSMNSVADVAYRDRTGGQDLWDLLSKSPKPNLLNEGAWDGDQSKLEIMFPKLYAKQRNFVEIKQRSK